MSRGLNYLTDHGFTVPAAWHDASD